MNWKLLFYIMISTTFIVILIFQVGDGIEISIAKGDYCKSVGYDKVAIKNVYKTPTQVEPGYFLCCKESYNEKHVPIENDCEGFLISEIGDKE